MSDQSRGDQEIIDPQLPYEERFRTVRHVLDVHYSDTPLSDCVRAEGIASE